MKKHDVSGMKKWWKENPWASRPLMLVGFFIIPIAAPLVLWIEHRDEWIQGMRECFAGAFLPWIDRQAEREQKWRKPCAKN